MVGEDLVERLAGHAARRRRAGPASGRPGGRVSVGRGHQRSWSQKPGPIGAGEVAVGDQVAVVVERRAGAAATSGWPGRTPAAQPSRDVEGRLVARAQQQPALAPGRARPGNRRGCRSWSRRRGRRRSSPSRPGRGWFCPGRSVDEERRAVGVVRVARREHGDEPVDRDVRRPHRARPGSVTRWSPAVNGLAFKPGARPRTERADREQRGEPERAGRPGQQAHEELAPADLLLAGHQLGVEGLRAASSLDAVGSRSSSSGPAGRKRWAHEMTPTPMPPSAGTAARPPTAVGRRASRRRPGRARRRC